MEIAKTDYLTSKEIQTLIYSDFTQDIGKIISEKLIKYCFITESNLYMLQENITYKLIKDDKLTLLNKVSILIQESYKSLSDTETENIRLKYAKVYNKIFTNSYIEKYYPQIVMGLTRNDVKFNYTPGQIHFENGFMDTLDGKLTFKQRTYTQYVTKCINRNYTPSTEKQRRKVLKPLQQVYPDKRDLDLVLLFLGSALSWKATRSQTALFLLGLGSSGKSFVLELTKAVMGCYFHQMKNNTFVVGNKNVDKILNTYDKDCQILFSWINEPQDSKMDGASFKIWVDGNLQSVKLYQEGSHDFKHNSIAITTANTMPQIIVESGTTRRIIAGTHVSHFTDIKSKLDSSKHIYLKDEDIIEKLTEECLLDAWFDILVEYCGKWLNKCTPEYSDNFKETKESIISTNDIFQDFVDSMLVFTDNEKDKIGKETMRTVFLKKYSDKHLNTIQVMQSMREHGLKYNTSMRGNDNVRGCYYGVKFKTDVDDEENEQTFNNGVDKTPQHVPMVLKSEYDELKRQLRMYQFQQLLYLDSLRKDIIREKMVELDEVQSLQFENDDDEYVEQKTYDTFDDLLDETVSGLSCFN